MEHRVLAGRYRLSDKLGQGGMGSVWRAEHLTLKSQVAVKLMEPSVADSLEALARFEREALSVAELRSTHIVQIIDYGIDEGTPYIVMELLLGENLGALIRRQGRLDLHDTTHILLQVARALAVAHGRGVIHRDLKPDNIFISNEGGERLVKVLDFGVAKRVDALAASTAPKTHTGLLLGTPYYMSPEQALGEPGLDARSDIWSLGIIAYECLTGRLPFEKGTLGALLQAICNERPASPSTVAEVPFGFDEWFARATARNKLERFATATEAVTSLAEVSNGAGADRLRGNLSATAVSTALAASPVLVAAVPDVDTESMSPASVTRSPTSEGALWKGGALFAAIMIVTGGAFLSANHVGKTAATASAGAIDAELRRWRQSGTDPQAGSKRMGKSEQWTADLGNGVAPPPNATVASATVAPTASSAGEPSRAPPSRSVTDARLGDRAPSAEPKLSTSSTTNRQPRPLPVRPSRDAATVETAKPKGANGGNTNFAGF
jgi:serine/threonine-protein kinase